MLHNFLFEIEIKSQSELDEIEISAVVPFGLKISAPRLLSAQTVGRLLYALFNKLNYLFDYLNYQIEIQESVLLIDKNILQEYLVLIFSTPFL